MVSAASADWFSARRCTRTDIEIVGINDLLDADYMSYMLRYDSVHGRFKGTVEVKDGKLVVNGKANPALPLKKILQTSNGVKSAPDYVVESTGLFLDKEKAGGHLKAGAKRVVLSRSVQG